MIKLSELNKMTGKVAIYVPATMDVDRICDNALQVEETARLLSAMFGGATATVAGSTGYWMDGQNKLVAEGTKVVFAFYTKQRKGNTQRIQQVIAHCTMLKDTMKQEAIAMELNNTLYFI